jgi:hypothetical protein
MEKCGPPFENPMHSPVSSLITHSQQSEIPDPKSAIGLMSAVIEPLDALSLIPETPWKVEEHPAAVLA